MRSTLTSADAMSSRSRPPRCPRSHGTERNCTAWVTSWTVTHVSSSPRSTCSSRAASRMFGATSSSRAGASSSRSESSYWPRTRRPMSPTTPPTSPARRSSAAPRSAGDVPEALSCSFVTSGSSVARIVTRFARAHAARSDGLGRGERRPRPQAGQVARSPPRPSRPRATRSPGRLVPAALDPATAPATRSARRQSRLMAPGGPAARPARPPCGPRPRGSGARGPGARRGRRRAR